MIALAITVFVYAQFLNVLKSRCVNEALGKKLKILSLSKKRKVTAR